MTEPITPRGPVLDGPVPDGPVPDGPVLDDGASPMNWAPPPRRLGLGVRLAMPVAITYVAALAISQNGGDRAGWWAILLGTAVCVVVSSVHESQRSRLLACSCGVLPLLALETHRATRHPGLLEIDVVWAFMPLFVAVASLAVGASIDVARTRWLPRRRPRSLLLLAGLLPSAAVLTLSLSSALFGWGGPSPSDALAEDAVVVSGPVTSSEGTGALELGGLTVFFDHDRGELGEGPMHYRYDLSPVRGDTGGTLGPSIELVVSGSREFLRPVGSRDVSRWARVDRTEGRLRSVRQGDAPPRRRAPRSISLALLLGLVAVALVLARRLWLARRRLALRHGLDAMVVEEGLALVESHPVHLPGAPQPGPVVVFGSAFVDGSYRTSPASTASRFVRGTRRGRALRSIAAEAHALRLAGALLLFGSLPALVALAEGWVLAGLV